MIWTSLREGRDPLETDPSSALFDGRVTQKTRSLARQFVQPPHWQVVERRKSSCGTVKLLVRLQDGLMVEMVVIPATNAGGTGAQRSTVCVR